MVTYWSHSTYVLEKFLSREVSLCFLPDKKMEGVAKALLSGLIFQKGVPLIFVNDEAKEFVDGVVHSMHRYLGIKQITTGGHNPRSNANVERFMQHLTSCLTKCDDTQYRNLKDYIQAIAFAHNQRLILQLTALLSRQGMA
jgi:hypothetical protein